MFEIVDGRTDNGRTPDHGYTISSPMSLGSAELKINTRTFDGNQNEPRYEKPAFCICENKGAD